jgi:hypothetical protein
LKLDYEPVNDPVLYDPLNTLKLELKLDILALNEAVAAFNSASVANVASSDELKFSKLVIRVENEPLVVLKLPESNDILELLFDMFILNEALST